MKKRLAAVLALLLAVGLVSCKEKLTPSSYQPEDFSDEGTVQLTIQHEYYDESVESYTYYITNNGEEAVSFRPEYEVEWNRDGIWYTLPHTKDYRAGNEENGPIQVAPGETVSDSFSFWAYDFTPVEGEYRLILVIGEETHAAVFHIGAKETEADSPYDQELEDLPEELDLTSFDCDLMVDSTGAVIGGSEDRVEGFLRKVSTDTPGVLRLVSVAEDGGVIVMDVLYEEGYFLLRRDESRMTEGVPGISERRFAYLVTDGEQISLSDFAAPEYQGGSQRYLEGESVPILSDTGTDKWNTMTGIVADITVRRIENDATMARYYSEDGLYWVNLTADPMDYTVTSATYGMSRTLKGVLPQGMEDMELVCARWIGEKQVELVCRSRKDEALEWTAVFDVDAEGLIS